MSLKRHLDPPIDLFVFLMENKITQTNGKKFGASSFYLKNSE